MAVHKLPPDLSDRIRSGFAVNSLLQCVMELLQNSIDAGALYVTVRVDTRSWSVQVADDGAGISLDNMQLVGQRFASSKCLGAQDLLQPRRFEFRGEALASVVQLSRAVKLASRHKLSQRTYCKKFQNGRAISTISTSPCLRAGPGTTVTLQDLFYNLPVRRHRMSGPAQLEEVAAGMRALALPHPLTAFSLHCEASGRCLLNVGAVPFLLARFRQLFGAGRASSLRPVSEEQAPVRLAGLVSVHSHHSKSLQFVYVNGRVVLNPEIHALLNSLLAPVVLLSKVAVAGGVGGRVGGAGRGGEKEAGGEMPGPPQPTRKPGNRQPVYVITIEVPKMYLDLFLESSKTFVHIESWDKVLHLLTSALVTFLTDNHFSLAHVSQICRDGAGGVGRPLQHHLGSLKVYQQHSSQKAAVLLQHSKNSSSLQHSKNSSSLQHSKNSSMTKKFLPTKNSASYWNNCSRNYSQFGNWKEQVGQANQQRLLVHPTTGNTLDLGSHFSNNSAAFVSNSSPPSLLPTLSPSSLLSPLAPNLPKTGLESGTRVSLQSACFDPCHCPLDSLLSSWTNPTFSSGPQAILNVTPSSRLRNLVPVQCKFSRTMLQGIKVLGQVDKKFIVCFCTTKTHGCEDLLVVIDQHAAHERIRLEGLIKGLRDEEGRVKSARVRPPLELYLPSSLEKSARLFSPQLQKIGVTLQQECGRLLVVALPAVVMESETGDRSSRGWPSIPLDLMQIMITRHLELLQATAGGVSGLPSSLEELLHSQACHGAIRFGDILSLSECEALMMALAECSLPFQCAHGRPSLAPLVNLCLLNDRFPSLLGAPFPSLRKLQVHPRANLPLPVTATHSTL